MGFTHRFDVVVSFGAGHLDGKYGISHGVVRSTHGQVPSHDRASSGVLAGTDDHDHDN